MDVISDIPKLSGEGTKNVSRPVVSSEPGKPKGIAFFGQSNFSVAEPTPAATKSTKNANVLLEFEKMVLSQFLEMMTKTTQSKTLGDGLSADIYNSYFAQAVAENIVQSGGMGIAKLVSDNQVAESEK